MSSAVSFSRVRRRPTARRACSVSSSSSSSNSATTKISVCTRARNARTRRSRVCSGFSAKRKPRTSQADPDTEGRGEDEPGQGADLRTQELREEVRHHRGHADGEPARPEAADVHPADHDRDEDGVGEQPVGRQHGAERDRRRRGQHQQCRGDPQPLDRGLVDRDVADHRQHCSHDHHGGLLAGEPLERDGQREREDDRQQRARRQAQPDEAGVDPRGGGAQLGPARAPQTPPPRPRCPATGRVWHGRISSGSAARSPRRGWRRRGARRAASRCPPATCPRRRRRGRPPPDPPTIMTPAPSR